VRTALWHLFTRETCHLLYQHEGPDIISVGRPNFTQANKLTQRNCDKHFEMQLDMLVVAVVVGSLCWFTVL
jgi:hypothetical protein